MKAIEAAALELAPNGLPVDSPPDIPILTASEHVIAAQRSLKGAEYCRNHLIRAWLTIDKAIRSIEPTPSRYVGMPASGSSWDNPSRDSSLTFGNRVVISLARAHGQVLLAADKDMIAQCGRLGPSVVATYNNDALRHLEEAREVLREWWEFVQ